MGDSSAKIRVTCEDWSRVTQLYYEALEMPREARQAFLESETESQPGVREEVQRLLNELPEESPSTAEPDVASMRPIPHLQENQIIGDFTILRLLGAGAFASVYLARQESLQRKVALKVSWKVGDEAKTLAQLEHDNIVKVHSQFVDGERCFVCMQFVPGLTLDSFFKVARHLPFASRDGHTIAQALRGAKGYSTGGTDGAGPQDSLFGLSATEVVLSLGNRLAQALHYAHCKGILHLDVKPSNVLIHDSGRAVLSDFNVSLSAVNVKQGTADSFGGTYTYMAPEQLAVFHASDEHKADAMSLVDQRTDVYSLGVILLEMLDTPLPGTGTIVSTREKDVGPSLPSNTSAIPKPRISESEVNTQLQTVLQIATASDKTQRFSSAAEFAEALNGLQTLYKIVQSLGKGGPLGFLTRRFPIASFFAVWATVQMTTFVLLLIYSHARLTLSGQSLMLGWTVAVGIVMAWTLKYLFASPHFGLERNAERIRVRTRRLYFLSAFMTAGLWLPMALALPTALHVLAGPLAPKLFGEIVLVHSFVGTLASAYAALFAEWHSVRWIYPRAWVGCGNVHEISRQELRTVSARMKPLWAVLIGLPLIVSASALLRFDDKDLAAGLFLVALAGAISLFLASHRIGRIVYAFCGGAIRQ